MLQLEGTRDFPQAPADLWARLSDARFVVQCLPDVESVSRAEPRTAVFSVRPGVSFVRGTLEVTLQVTDAVPDESLTWQVHTRGIGSTSDVGAAVILSAQDGGTRLHWAATVQKLGGLLKAIPSGLIQASAQKVIADVWEAVDRRLARP